MGRAIGIALFWLLALHVIGTSTYSVVGQLYWPEAFDADPLERDCADRLGQLQQELLGASGQWLHGGSAAELKRWFSAWDTRFARVPTNCGTLERAREDLLALRTDLERMLREYQQTQSPVRDRIKEALQPYAASSSSS